MIVEVTYCTNKHKKHKIFKDGTLKINDNRNRLYLYNDANAMVTEGFLNIDRVEDKTEFSLGRNLIRLEEEEVMKLENSIGEQPTNKQIYQEKKTMPSLSTQMQQRKMKTQKQQKQQQHKINFEQDDIKNKINDIVNQEHQQGTISIKNIRKVLEHQLGCSLKNQKLELKNAVKRAIHQMDKKIEQVVPTTKTKKKEEQQRTPSPITTSFQEEKQALKQQIQSLQQSIAKKQKEEQKEDIMEKRMKELEERKDNSNILGVGSSEDEEDEEEMNRMQDDDNITHKSSTFMTAYQFHKGKKGVKPPERNYKRHTSDRMEDDEERSTFRNQIRTKKSGYHPIASLRAKPLSTTSSNSGSQENTTAKKRKRFQTPYLKDTDQGEPKKYKKKNQGGQQRRGNADENDKKKDIPECVLKLFEGKEVPYEELEKMDMELVRAIVDDILDDGDEISWDDIAGLDHVKASLRQEIIWPILRPNLFQGLLKPSKGILLFGPPGTGKTLIGKAISREADATFFLISSSSLMSKWVGEGEKLVRTLFRIARLVQPSIIFIDEIDSILSKRGSDDSNTAGRRLKTEFMVQLDGAGTRSHDQIMIIGATNLPGEIDSAILRRMAQKFYIHLPPATSREGIIRKLLSKYKADHTLTDDHIKEIVQKTDGYSGSDMNNLVNKAARQCLKYITDITKVDSFPPITLDDFMQAMKIVRPSVDQSTLKDYIDWNDKFGVQ